MQKMGEAMLADVAKTQRITGGSNFLLYEAYERAMLTMQAALEADSDWDFDKNPEKDKVREKLIYNIAKAIERRAEMDFNEGDMKEAKNGYKTVQQMMFSLMPRRKHDHEKTIAESYQRQQSHVMKRYSEGALSDILKGEKNQAKIDEALEALINKNVRDDLGKSFFKKKLFTLDEQHLYYKTNMQLAYMYSTRAAVVPDEGKKETLSELAEQEYQYAWQYAQGVFQIDNLIKEQATHYLRMQKADLAVKLLEDYVKGKHFAQEDDKESLKEQEDRIKEIKGVYSNLGTGYFHMKNYRMALEAFKTAQKSEGNSDHLHIYTVRTYLKLNQENKAIKYLEDVEETYGPQEVLESLRRAIGKYLKTKKAKSDTEDPTASDTSDSSASKAR